MWNVMQKLALALGFVTVLGAGQARADIVKQQAPCDSACVAFAAGVGGIYTVRSLSFTAPGPGALLLSFHGVLYCTNFAATKSTILVASQIVENSDDPDGNGPSGLSFSGSLEPGNTSLRTLSFNLSSQRVFKIRTPGSYTYRFRLERSNLPADTNCTVYNGTFQTHFVE